MAAHPYQKLAQILVDHSAGVKPGDRVAIETTTIAYPVYGVVSTLRESLKSKGALLRYATYLIITVSSLILGSILLVQKPSSLSVPLVDDPLDSHCKIYCSSEFEQAIKYPGYARIG